MQSNRFRILSLETSAQGAGLREAAGPRGIGVMGVASVSEAEQIVGTGKFDLILVNISTSSEHLAFISGLKHRQPAILTPVIAIAEPLSPFVEDAYDAGAACVITRPNDQTAKFAALDECLTFWTRIAMLPGEAHSHRRTADTSRLG